MSLKNILHKDIINKKSDGTFMQSLNLGCFAILAVVILIIFGILISVIY